MQNPVPDYLHEILDSLRDDRGTEAVDAAVGVDPSGEAFDELSQRVSGSPASGVRVPGRG